MATMHSITAGPAGKALTLDELAAFIEEARRAGASGSETPKVRINMGGTIKRAEVEIRSSNPTDGKEG